MRRAELLRGIRAMRFVDIHERHTQGRLTVEEAAELLGVHERTFRRWVCRYEEQGAEGLVDQRVGRLAHNAAPVDEVMAIVALFETRYRDFNVSHFYDKYREEHKGQRCYTWVKRQLQARGATQKAKRRGTHRRRRPRRPLKGMMLHQDGSSHEWVCGKRWDLIVTMDDADSEIYSARFVDEEGTWSSLRGIKEVIQGHGLFCSLYTDRGSHYWYTAKEGGKVDKHQLTQVGRAMKQLGIEMIPAYSPEARGRSERTFGTLQGRLPNELELAGITEMEPANRFLAECYISRFNERFRVKPEGMESAFVPWQGALVGLDDILCIQEPRTVNNDNTVRYQNKLLQLPKSPYRHSYKKVPVMVHEYETGQLAIFHGPRCLARYWPERDHQEWEEVMPEGQ